MSYDAPPPPGSARQLPYQLTISYGGWIIWGSMPESKKYIHIWFDPKASYPPNKYVQILYLVVHPQLREVLRERGCDGDALRRGGGLLRVFRLAAGLGAVVGRRRFVVLLHLRRADRRNQDSSVMEAEESGYSVSLKG